MFKLYLIIHFSTAQAKPCRREGKFCTTTEVIFHIHRARTRRIYFFLFRKTEKNGKCAHLDVYVYVHVFGVFLFMFVYLFVHFFQFGYSNFSTHSNRFELFLFVFLLLLLIFNLTLFWARDC